MAKGHLSQTNPELHRQIASKGGKATPAHKRIFYRDPEWAKEMGRRGGLARQANLKDKRNAK